MIPDPTTSLIREDTQPEPPAVVDSEQFEQQLEQDALHSEMPHAEPGSKPIAYFVKYVTIEGSKMHLQDIQEVSSEPSSETLEALESKENKGKQIEIFTIAKCARDGNGKVLREDKLREGSKVGKPKFKIQNIEEVSMIIYWPELVEAIRQIVLYYPSEAIGNGASHGIITTRKPYHMFHSYRDEIRKLRESYNQTAQGEGNAISSNSEERKFTSGDSQLTRTSDSGQQNEDPVNLEDFTVSAGMQPLPQLPCNEKLYRQLLCLEDILDRAHKTEVEKEKLCHAVGTANFEMLWYLFRPGTFVFVKDGDRLTGAVVVFAQEKTYQESVYKRNGSWSIICWHLGFDGTKVRRIKLNINIPAYNESRKITDLPVYPIEFAEDRSLLKKLVGLGKKYWEFLRCKYVQAHYRGELLSNKAWYNGRVILDPVTAQGPKTPSKTTQMQVRLIREILPQSTTEYYIYGDDCLLNMNDDNRGAGITGKRYLWEGFDGIDPKDPNTTHLTNRHYFLFPRGIRGFALQSRKWVAFDIDCISDCPRNENALDDLVLGKKQKSIIKALSRSAGAEKSAGGSLGRSGELKDGRREGRIFLLHGPSGVGKTFTAQCVALSTGRPLLSLTCAELGTLETEIERKLDKFFTLASIWDAIILIDEADVYVHSRKKDPKSGNLVAAFLRALETFRNDCHGGIIFLTTNRIFQIDTAVRSRVHIPIYYPPLGEEERKEVYKKCVKDLSQRGFEMPQSSSFLKTMDDMKWNGREISNALQTIASLAEDDHPVDDSLNPTRNIEISNTHIELVVKQLSLFKAYFDESKVGESDVAQGNSERNDEWIWSVEAEEKERTAKVMKQHAEIEKQIEALKLQKQEIQD